ncbi:MAG: RsmD family RNA methyltransferase [Planctomycetota bacterium]
MAKLHRSKSANNPGRGKAKLVPTKLRIVSGEFRGRRISYNGDPATRPMKEKTREAVFSLLGGRLPETCALDLFGGTGILGMEAVSRGAKGAIILELMHKSVATMKETLEGLELNDRIRVQNVDTIRWLKNFELQQLRYAQPNCDWNLPWIVFVCPPYKLWVAESEKLVAGLGCLVEAAPSGSKIICETDKLFSVADSIDKLDWDVRHYDPAYISIAQVD